MIEIMKLREQGVGVKEIARRTGFSRNTVRKYLRNPSVPRYGPRTPQSSPEPSVLSFLHQSVATMLPCS